MKFWKSAGFHLLDRDDRGWLRVTPDYLRAYYTRPEIHPVEESCQAEHALFEKLMADPFAAVDRSETDAIVDADAEENYQILLRFRDHLTRHGTIESAYSTLFGDGTIAIPPMFIDQMVHLILANILESTDDPFQLRAAELFFRAQVATVGDDELMLADQEIVEMRSQTGGFGGLGQLLVESGTPMREVALDVMTEKNKSSYWERSDRFDMAIDFRFTQPAQDALARVIEAWIAHFLGVKTRIQAKQSIRDEKWTWHIGCDSESTNILNRLYEGEEVGEEDLYKLIALYQLEFLQAGDVMDSVRGKPVYLGLAMNEDNKVVFKPQNLLTNLPIKARD